VSTLKSKSDKGFLTLGPNIEKKLEELEETLNSIPPLQTAVDAIKTTTKRKAAAKMNKAKPVEWWTVNKPKAALKQKKIPT